MPLKDKSSLRIIFFGTPTFAATSLKLIFDKGYNIVAVVSAPDKPAGRGYQVQASAVKACALELNLPILQPSNLKSPEFIETLKSYQADIQIVIAFRMLPEMVWNMPPMGTFNLHGSFLPAYRGAAPINRAIMNGETETGLSTFFLKHEIDTGSILLQEKTSILPEDNAGTLHDKMMEQGAGLVIKSLEQICTGEINLTLQADGDFPHAPKIFTEDCTIDWSKTAQEIHNQIRGLSPYPTAFTEFRDKKLKVFASQLGIEKSENIGLIEAIGKDKLFAHCSDYKLELTDIQLEGKKRMPVKDFINGMQSLT
jgi:methionyl-tRNA formyltransferase